MTHAATLEERLNLICCCRECLAWPQVDGVQPTMPFSFTKLPMCVEILFFSKNKMLQFNSLVSLLTESRLAVSFGTSKALLIQPLSIKLILPTPVTKVLEPSATRTSGGNTRLQFTQKLTITCHVMGSSTGSFDREAQKVLKYCSLLLLVAWSDLDSIMACPRYSSSCLYCALPFALCASRMTTRCGKILFHISCHVLIHTF